MRGGKARPTATSWFNAKKLSVPGSNGEPLEMNSGLENRTEGHQDSRRSSVHASGASIDSKKKGTHGAAF